DIADAFIKKGLHGPVEEVLVDERPRQDQLTAELPRHLHGEVRSLFLLHPPKEEQTVGGPWLKGESRDVDAVVDHAAAGSPMLDQLARLEMAHSRVPQIWPAPDEPLLVPVHRVVLRMQDWHPNERARKDISTPADVRMHDVVLWRPL